ncbi:MAG: 50S ribosomal protein L29 [Candidatus Omnitrophica bacterium]|nr:50S ribosomal protein L29 [bacterium]NUN97464.1 50S ribosomal protein L29 [Candidatus Omnitrophota bacterium]
MKANEFRDMTKTELSAKIGALKEELFSLRFKMNTGQIENNNQLRILKRDIARGLTVLREVNAAEKTGNA